MNYFTDEQIREMAISLGLNVNKNYCDGMALSNLKALMNLAIATAIGKEVAYLASHPSGNQEQAIYWPNEYENWHENDESKGWEFLPLYTVKEIS